MWHLAWTFEHQALFPSVSATGGTSAAVMDREARNLPPPQQKRLWILREGDMAGVVVVENRLSSAHSKGLSLGAEQNH